MIFLDYGVALVWIFVLENKTLRQLAMNHAESFKIILNIRFKLDNTIHYLHSEKICFGTRHELGPESLRNVFVGPGMPSIPE